MRVGQGFNRKPQPLLEFDVDLESKFVTLQELNTSCIPRNGAAVLYVVLCMKVSFEQYVAF